MLAKPAKTRTAGCHAALCDCSQQKVCAGGITLRGCFTEALNKCRVTDLRVNWRDQRSSWQKHRAEAKVQESSHPSPVAIAPKRASFSCLDSLHVDLFAGSVPQREILSCLCAKLNMSFLLGNLIFHRRGNNIFSETAPSSLRKGPAPGPLHLHCRLSWRECVLHGNCFV